MTGFKYRDTSISPLRKRRPGFTLVELLVVVTIMIILSALTFSLINMSMDGERLTNGANQVQTYLEGARDRAIHAGAPRGVRFILDRDSLPGFPTITSMIYIGPPEQYGEGRIIIRNDVSGMPRDIEFSGTNWSTLVDSTYPSRSFLVNGARIRFPTVGNGTLFYTLIQNSSIPSGWSLTRDFPASSVNTPLNYELELAPTVLDRQDPEQFPRNIVIDLTNSRTPSWLSDTSRMDILFSPRGTVVGNAATRGMIHLLFSERTDVEFGYGIGDVLKERGEMLITVITATGAVNKHPVVPGDPFRLAETGKEAK